jgi:hypothetical protein
VGHELILMSEPADSWQAYRRNRKVVQIMFWGFMPVVFLSAVLGDRFLHTSPFIVALGWMTFMVAVDMSEYG